MIINYELSLTKTKNGERINTNQSEDQFKTPPINNSFNTN